MLKMKMTAHLTQASRSRFDKALEGELEALAVPPPRRSRQAYMQDSLGGYPSERFFQRTYVDPEDVVDKAFWTS